MPIRNRSRLGSWKDELRLTVPWLCSGKCTVCSGIPRLTREMSLDQRFTFGTMDKVYNISTLQKVMASWEKVILGSNRSTILDQIC